MKKKIVFGVLLAVIITVVVGTYMYSHRFDKYEQRWYDMPMAIYSFLEGYDFSGKTIVLFTTHGGNRFCRTVPTVRKLFPKTNVVQGPAIYDREMDKAEQSLDEWLKDNELVN